MKTRSLPILIGLALVLAVAGFAVRPPVSGNSGYTTTSVQFVNSTVTAGGFVTAQNQAVLNFQTPGKLVYLPFKAGDTVTAGRTLARLDTYALQRQLSLALNNYRTIRNTFDQTQQNSQDNVLKTQIAPTYLNENIADNSVVVNDALKRIVDQSQAGLDSSVINVELANYALQLSSLTSPLNGIITREDVTVSGVNITPATTFTVADPDSMVFRANIPMENIYYVAVGSTVSLAIDGLPGRIGGTVVKIYPSKVVLSNGLAVYQVDITSPNLKNTAKFDETGTAIISTNSENVALVPAWTVLSGRYIWIDDHGTPDLKQVTVGKMHDNQIEITGGLSSGDKIITNPQSISSLKYHLL
jgi:RND family efflux transporter MFP subunit